MSATAPGFNACLFDPDLGNEVVEGRISIEPRALRFQSEAVSDQIPIDRVAVEFEERGPRIQFTDPERPDLRIFTRDHSILKHRSFIQSPLHAQVRAAAGRRELGRRLRITLYFLLGCVLLTWLGSWATSVMVRSLVARVPPEWERRFGQAEMKALQSEGVLIEDTNELARLAAVAAPLTRVVAAGQGEFRFHLVNSDEPNAFALPGGDIVVNTGLLKLADRPEELLGVLAHELAHVTQRHVARKVISAAGPLVIFGVFLHSRSGLMNLLGAGTGLMVFQGFSQEYETEADDVGWRYLVAANIDPSGMISMFQKLKAYEAERTKELKRTGESELPQAFQSHPALDKRIARLERRWTHLAHQSGFVELDAGSWNSLKAALKAPEH